MESDAKGGTLSFKNAMSIATKLAVIKQSALKKAPPHIIDTLASAISKLEGSGLTKSALQVGQQIPEFNLPDATGNMVSSTTLLAKGPLLVSFYRGGWCPYCNVELRALQSHLKEFQRTGVTLVAISPQMPDHSLSTQEKAGLQYPVLSDVGNQLARKFGIVYQLDENLRSIYQKLGVDLEAQNGGKAIELPVPATYLVDSKGTVRNAFIDVDYTKRLEPTMALSWIDALGEQEPKPSPKMRSRACRRKKG
jgi:peroxiredoxin